MTGEYPMPFFILGIVIDCNGNICNNILEFTVTTHITAAGKHAKHVDDGNGSHRQVRLRDLIKYAKARAIAEQLDVKATNINNCLLGLTMENEMISKGISPTHEMTVKWLEACADKFQDCAEQFAASRGFKIIDKQSLTNINKLENKNAS